MRKIREILRLNYDLGLSDRQIAASVSVSPTTVGEYLRRAEEAEIGWPLPEDVDDEVLQGLLRHKDGRKEEDRPYPDPVWIQKELARPRVTLKLLWEEYRQQNPDNHYSYPRFCSKYREWRRAARLTMRQSYRAGEKIFCDFSGDTFPVVDPATGEISEAEVFVASLGYSSFTYVQACPSKNLESTIGAHIGAFEYFEGVTELLIPDNMRTAVSKACRYEPDLNPTYAEMAEHYGCAVIPARVRHPQDKAKVESAVLQVQRWVLAPLRNRVFCSLGELNQAFREKLYRLNTRPMRDYGGRSRLDLYLESEAGVLRPLPQTPYEFGEWRKATVGIDYHIDVEHHFYSVPYRLTGERVEVRLTARTLEVVFRGKRVASHLRSYQKGVSTTDDAHRPASHRAHLEWTPSRIVGWAEKTGPATAELASEIMRSRPHPEQGYRSCLGIIRLGDKYGAERVEGAARRALELGTISYRSMKSILAAGLDRVEAEGARSPLPQHANLRGPGYYN